MNAIDPALNGQPRPRRAPRVRLVPFGAVHLSTGRRQLIKRLVPRTGIVIAWGPPKCGKSFWVFDIAMHVALGWTYRGRRVQQGAVIYCAFEGQGGIDARAEAFRQNFLPETPADVPLWFEVVTLDLVREHRELIRAITETLVDTVPAMVVLDTLNKSLVGSEARDEDMAAYLRAAEGLVQAFGCVVVIVHHCGVDGTRPRGHTSLTAAADAQIAVSRDAAKNVVVRVESMKDGEEGDEIVSRLQPVTVGEDEDGDAVTSCIVVPVEGAPASDRARPAIPRNWQTMLSILQEAGPAGLTTDDWNDRAREIGLGSSRRSDLYDFRRGLQQRGLVVQGAAGWLASRDGSRVTGRHRHGHGAPIEPP
jgi:hypothetical protein